AGQAARAAATARVARRDGGAVSQPRGVAGAPQAQRPGPGATHRGRVTPRARSRRAADDLEVAVEAELAPLVVHVVERDRAGDRLLAHAGELEGALVGADPLEVADVLE